MQFQRSRQLLSKQFSEQMLRTSIWCWLCHLLSPKVEVVGVEQELWLVVELGRELLDVTAAVQAVVPGGGYIGEEAIGMVKPAPLQVTVHGSERLHPDQVEEDCACNKSRCCCSVPCQEEHFGWSKLLPCSFWFMEVNGSI